MRAGGPWTDGGEERSLTALLIVPADWHKRSGASMIGPGTVAPSPPEASYLQALQWAPLGEIATHSSRLLLFVLFGRSKCALWRRRHSAGSVEIFVACCPRAHGRSRSTHCPTRRPDQCTAVQSQNHSPESDATVSDKCYCFRTVRRRRIQARPPHCVFPRCAELASVSEAKHSKTTAHVRLALYVCSLVPLVP